MVPMDYHENQEMIIEWILMFLAGAHPFPPSFATRENIWIHNMSEVNFQRNHENQLFKIQHMFSTFWGHVPCLLNFAQV